MRNTGRNRYRRLRAVLALTAAAPLMVGCVLLEGPTPATPEREAPAVPDVAPEFVPGGSASDNLPYFTEVLRAYAEGEAPVTGQPIVDAVAAAGFDKAVMQVSFDESMTGLDADNIFVSVRMGADCLIGQIVASDREFAVQVEPAVGPAQDICLIGKTRQIDW